MVLLFIQLFYGWKESSEILAVTITVVAISSCCYAVQLSMLSLCVCRHYVYVAALLLVSFRIFHSAGGLSSF
jgi:hypothetical protein